MTRGVSSCEGGGRISELAVDFTLLGESLRDRLNRLLEERQPFLGHEAHREVSVPKVLYVCWKRGVVNNSGWDGGRDGAVLKLDET